jgi:hypothetical protein
MTLTLSALERAVVEKLLSGEHPVLQALRQQALTLKAKSRELTGVGFYTTFGQSGAELRAGCRQGVLRVGDVVAELHGLQHGAGFVLYIKDGFINMLEGFSYDEPWPAICDTFALRYVNNDRSVALASLLSRAEA